MDREISPSINIELIISVLYYVCYMLMLSESPCQVLLHYSLTIIATCNCNCNLIGPLPPSSIRFSPINKTSLLVQWTPSLLWEGYIIDYYYVNITDLVFSDSVNSSNPQLTVTQPSSVISCTVLNFSISAVNRNYGESNPITAVRGFDTSINKYLNCMTKFGMT